MRTLLILTGLRYDIRYDTKSLKSGRYSQLSLAHGTETKKLRKTKKYCGTLIIPFRFNCVVMRMFVFI